MGVESGTCNVCSSPCKSCMHNNRTVLKMESKEECGSSCNRMLTKEDVSYSSTYANEMPRYKKRSLDDLPFTGSEANNLPSSCSSHDSYSKNAESKASVKVYATCGKFDDVDMSPVSLKETNRNKSLEKTSVSTDISHRIHLKQDEEVISCLTENKDFNVEVGHYSIGLGNKDSICSFVPSADIKNIVKVEATNCFPGSDIEESQSNCRRYIAHPEDSLKECEDYISSPFHAKPNLLLTNNGYDDCHKNVCKSSDNGFNCEVKDDGKSSLKTQVVEHEYREGKNSAGLYLTDEYRLGKDVSSKASMASTTINNESETFCLLDESNVKESRQVIEGGSSGTEQELTDVNVCDICGDVGREYLLAVCSNCSDGAEHIYCMRKMLRKVPEGDWLCETCQLKEQTEKRNVENRKETTSTHGKCKFNVGPEITKMDNLEKVLEKPKECRRKKCPDTMKRDMCEVPETSKIIKQKAPSMSNLRTVTKFDTKPENQDRKKRICNLQSPNFSVKRHAEYQEILSPKSRPPDNSGRFVEMGSPRKKPRLSREASFKNLDGRKEGTACITLSIGGQNTNKIPTISRSQSILGSHLSKAPSPLQSPHRLISRSSSFNINPTSKVKQYAEDVPFKREFPESSLSIQRKNAILGSKSTSFKSIGNKTKLHVDPRSVLFHKKKENMENKCNPTSDHLPASPKASTGIHISKKNVETTMSNVKSKHHLYEPKRHRLDKGSSDANDIRNKSSMKHSDDQRLCLSPRARSGVISMKESVKSNSIVKIAESATFIEIPMAASVINTPQIAVSHTSAQSCSTDKLKSSSVEPSDENNSMDDVIKKNKGSSDANDIRNKSSLKHSDDQRLCLSPRVRSGVIPIKESVKSNSVVKIAESATCIEIPMAVSVFDTPQIAVSHVSAQSCSTDKLKSSAVEPSDENSSLDNVIKRNKGSNDIRNKSSMKHSDDQRLCLSPRAHSGLIPMKESVKSNGIVKIAESATCIEIPMAGSVINTPQIAVSHTSAQSCSTDKLKSSAVEPSDENNSMDDVTIRNKGSSDANDIRNKSSMKHFDDQRSCLSPRASSGVIPIKESVKSNSIVKIAESAMCIEIPMAASVLNTPQIAVSHTSAQSCPSDKLKSSSVEPSSENNSMDDGIKRNKWKDAIKKTILKAKSQNMSNTNGLDNQLAEFHPASNVISHTVEISNEHNILKDSPSAEVACTFKDTHSPETIDLNAIAAASDEMTIQVSQHANSHTTLAIPNFEYIWQGNFEVLSEVESAPYYGIQAHLSTTASPKVHEMTTKFLTEIMLEEVPWTSSWPVQFQGINPDENNIALFFFAKDIESYEKSYSKLLEKMLKNDLSLKGIIDGVELLIFPSTKLPVQSQRWNQLFFLWGVFKAKRPNNFIPKSGYQKEPLGPNLKFHPKTEEDLPSTPKIEVSNCKLPSCSASSACVDNVVISTPKVEGISFTHKSRSFDQNPSVLSSSYNRPPDDQKSSFLSSSYNLRLDHTNHASYFCGNNSHLSNKSFSLPESRIQLTDTPPCSESKNDSSYLKLFDSNMSGKSAHLSTSNLQIWHSRESHSPTSPGTNYSRNITKDKEIPVKNGYILYDEHNKEEDRSNTNHACTHSNYFPLPSPTSNEILNLRASSNVHPLFCPIVKPDNAKAADKNILFFLNGTRTVPNTQPDNVVEIYSSDEEDALNPNRLNLDLVLWNKRTSELEEKWKMTDADDEESASLSLSLAIPAAKKDQSKKEDDLQENSNTNPPLRLFGTSIGI